MGRAMATRQAGSRLLPSRADHGYRGLGLDSHDRERWWVLPPDHGALAVDEWFERTSEGFDRREASVTFAGHRSQHDHFEPRVDLRNTLAGSGIRSAPEQL